jgi:type VI secretion system secreted protein VgrG
MKDHPDKPFNKEYLIISSSFSVTVAEGSSGAGSDDGDTMDTYRVTFRAIPGDVPFRLERHTPRPMIRGPQTAKVVGTSGEEIDTDQYGRVKVKFPLGPRRGGG